MDNHIRTLILGFTFDRNYLYPFWVSLTSVFLNNRNVKIQIHVVASELRLTEKKAIVDYVISKNASIHFYTVDESYIRKFAVVKQARYPTSVYFRLFLADLIPVNVEKILYLDIDTVTIGPLCQLFELESDPHPIAVAPDSNVVRPDLGLGSEGTYFNSGVMLINLKQWRKQKVTENAIQYLAKNPEKILFHDQDALNAVLAGNWVKVDVKYNLTFRDIPDLTDYQTFLKDKVIIHYNDWFKPWSTRCTNNLKYIYNYYALKYFNSPIGKKVILKDVDAWLQFLVVKCFRNDNPDIDTTMLLSYALHLAWIKTLSKVFYEGIIAWPLFENYDENWKNDQAATEKFVSHYNDNRDILVGIFHAIMNKGEIFKSSKAYSIMWLSCCQNVIFESGEDLAYLKKNVPELINKRIHLTEIEKSLLNFFIVQTAKNELQAKSNI